MKVGYGERRNNGVFIYDELFPQENFVSTRITKYICTIQSKNETFDSSKIVIEKNCLELSEHVKKITNERVDDKNKNIPSIHLDKPISYHSEKIQEQPMFSNISYQNNSIYDGSMEEQIFYYLKQRERSNLVESNFLAIQNEVDDKMRFILLDWIFELTVVFKMERETFFLAANLLDRYTKIRRIGKKEYQLVGITCLFIASKYEEPDHISIKDLSKSCKKFYKTKDIRRTEIMILTTLDFKVVVSTASQLFPFFLKSFSKVNGIKENDLVLSKLTEMICESCIFFVETCTFLPSLIASASVYLALKLYHEEEFLWDQVTTGYKEKEIISFARMVKVCLEKLFDKKRAKITSIVSNFIKGTKKEGLIDIIQQRLEKLIL